MPAPARRATDHNVSSVVTSGEIEIAAAVEGQRSASDDPLGGIPWFRRVVIALLIVCLFVASSSAWAQINLVHVTTCGPGTFPGTRLHDSFNREQQPDRCCWEDGWRGKPGDHNQQCDRQRW